MEISAASFAAFALLPPGSEARKLADIKRQLFEEEAAAAQAGSSSAGQDGSGSGERDSPALPGIAFPDAAFLAFCSLPAGRHAGLGPGAIRGLGGQLRGVWKGIEGRFLSGPRIRSGAGLYLELKGPLAPLKERVKLLGGELLPGLEWSGCLAIPGGCPVENCGFYLGPALNPPETEEKSPEEPQILSFMDAELVLLRISLSLNPAGLVWKELAAGRRSTGPRQRRL